MVPGKGNSAPGAGQTAIDKRRARNRVSQKSFRERQGLYVKQLEKQLAESSRSESAKILDLQEEAKKLRIALLAARKRIRGLTTALDGVSDHIGVALGLESDSGNSNVGADRDRDEDAARGDTESESLLGSCEDDKMSMTDLQETGDNSSLLLPQHVSEEETQPLAAPETLQTSHIAPLESNLQRNFHGVYLPFDTDTFLDAGTPPGNYSVQYRGQSYVTRSDQNTDNQPSNTSTNILRVDLQKGPSYSDNFNLLSGPVLQEPNILSDLVPPGNFFFPSSASAHLAVCEFFIKHNRAYKQRHLPGGNEALSKLISNMVNMFINTAWPEIRPWWAYMQSSAVVEKIIRWRLDPSLESYQDLKPCHRPTTTQLCIVHPPIIDWGFFPCIRDKLIELYSHSWVLDDLMFEMLNAYVVETDLTGIVIGLGEGLPNKGYFCIWDIVQTISKEEDEAECIKGLPFWEEGSALEAPNSPASPFQIDEDEEGEEGWTPMTLDDIYRSKKAAQKLFKMLRMDDRTRVKINPVFVAKHPELCDDPSILASGVDCTAKGMTKAVPSMKPLTRETIMNYKMMLWKTVT